MSYSHRSVGVPSDDLLLDQKFKQRRGLAEVSDWGVSLFMYYLAKGVKTIHKLIASISDLA